MLANSMFNALQILIGRVKFALAYHGSQSLLPDTNRRSAVVNESWIESDYNASTIAYSKELVIFYQLAGIKDSTSQAVLRTHRGKNAILEYDNTVCSACVR